MISFIWSSLFPLLPGTGGSENYTIGQVRELQRRNIPVRIITLGFGKDDGRKELPDIDFFDISNESELTELDDKIVFVSEPLNVPTKHQSYTILHCPPGDVRLKKDFLTSDTRCSQPIVTSHHAAQVWSKVLDIPAGNIPVVYPFASPEFSKEKHTKSKKTRVLFAGRVTPDKGVYTLLWALHSDKIKFDKFEFRATNAGKQQPNAKMLIPMLEAHPHIELIEAKKTPTAMAKLMARTDVVVMPSSFLWWDEMFGIVSVEAQHAGCRVVASNAGGIPETDCGGLILIEPDNPKALEAGILKASKMGRMTTEERQNATEKFTIVHSVDKLLEVICETGAASRTRT